jgi:uncharacterized membrane protein YidH (DUF202 family)
VHFEGWREDPASWIAGASACVVPSRFDAWSQTVVLAMSLRVPVVGTAWRACPACSATGAAWPAWSSACRMILMAGVIGLMSYQRWRTLERSLRLGRPLPYASPATPLGIAIGEVAVGAIVVLVTD